MRGQRVVITGMGAISPYGAGVDALMRGLCEARCAVRRLPPEQVLNGVGCMTSSRVPPLNSKHIPRELRRAMSPMSVFAVLAAWEALQQAGFKLDGARPRMGVAAGSTLGSAQALEEFFAEYLAERGVDSVRSTTFFKIMGHSVAANLALACDCRGRLLAPAAACASGLLALGLGCEAIASGREDLMLCGGADEFHALTAATFDRLGAASHASDPSWASRPFDLERDGVVCGEGAGIILLESLDSARRRGVTILAEIRGFASISSSAGIAHPDSAAIADCMREALDDAGLKPRELGYVNAHATGTRSGDMAEGQAVADLLGVSVPVSGLKGHLGHTMAASGALESIACVEMLRLGRYLPTLGLRHPDPQCGKIRHLRKGILLDRDSLLKNSFALGGCNTSLIISKYRKG